MRSVVAVESFAWNLVAGDTNGTFDAFIHDRQTGATERVSVATGGTRANGSGGIPAISADGRGPPSVGLGSERHISYLRKIWVSRLLPSSD